MPRYDHLKENLLKKPILCSNLGLGEQGAVLSNLDSAVVIMPTIETAKSIKQQLESLNKTCALTDNFSSLFTLSKYSTDDNKIDLINALYSLLKQKTIVVSKPELLFCPSPKLDVFSSRIVNIKKGDDIPFSNLEKVLVKNGYKRCESVNFKGEFARHGDILDIYPPTGENPYRVDFFDTMVEDIYSFDPLTFERLDSVNSIDIVPNRLLLLDDTEREKILHTLDAEKKSSELIIELYNKIERDEDVPLEFLLPFYDGVSFFYEFDLPIVLSGALQIGTIFDRHTTTLAEKVNNLFKDEKLKNLYKNSKIFINFSHFLQKFKKKLIFFDNYDSATIDLKNKLGIMKADDCAEINFKTKAFPSFLFNLENLSVATKKYWDKQIYLCLENKETLSAVQKILSETGVSFSTNKNSTGLILTELKIPYNICFEDEERFYLGSTNFAHKKIITAKEKKAVKYLPKANEYVVHSTHGIGRCEGIVNMKVSGVDKEFFKLIYKGGDVLYVPTESADCLSLYMADGDQVNLNKLGGKEFATQKMKAVKSIENMSTELLELYAKRKATKGVKYDEDDYLYLEFEAKFPYDETSDQMQAINDVKRDMTSGKLMDRLICGDVGFGKTEVAMRALFKTVEKGKQVAILAPTTVLSMQHFKTTSQRTADFGVNVAMLNRFVSKSEQKQILEDLSLGKVNVICATHRLLSADVKFHDLGLLILDEEQRFGVKAKEYIKNLKNNVNVLTLSATPIPRTLSMSLMSIRDISLITTPPVNRKPVKTYILGYKDEVVVNAINDELARDGQVLIVYNNIEKIYTFAENLKSQITNPKAVFDIAHGKMSEGLLEKAIKRLYEGETNIFLSTTLIENGVDLPRANTLIVVDSDRLGLSQMYQLRGRVGRSSEQAFAYFTFDPQKVLTEESSARLQALAENTELGSGFKIAMRDMSIRGAGEILGKEQHGHIVKIGYEMYSKLLDDTLKRLKGEKVDESREVKIDIAITSKIPYSFVEEESERLKIIARISNISDKASAKSCLNELSLTYGKLPKEIYQLANIALIKSLAQKAKIKDIIINKAKMAIIFYENVDLDRLISKVAKFPRFRFERTGLPSILLDPHEFSVQTAQSYLIEFLSTT